MRFFEKTLDGFNPNNPLSEEQLLEISHKKSFRGTSNRSRLFVLGYESILKQDIPAFKVIHNAGLWGFDGAIHGHNAFRSVETER